MILSCLSENTGEQYFDLIAEANIAMTRKRKWLYVSLTFGLTIGLIEFVSFVAVRLMVEQSDPIQSETHLFAANRSHRPNPDFQLPGDPRSKLNASDGFRRDTPVSLEKPERTVRIIALGTSALYGIGARSPYPEHRPLYNDETITYYLERQLREGLQADGIDYDVEVINAGVSAYKTFHHLIYLNSDLLDYKPDIVINIDGHNDFYKTVLDDRWNTYAYSTSILVDEFNGRTFFLPFLTSVRALAPYSNLFNLLERISRRMWYRRVEQPLPHTPHRELPQLEDFEANVRQIASRTYLCDLWQIHQLGSFSGYDHYVFLQPEVVFEDGQQLSEHDRQIQEITLREMARDRSDAMKQIRALLPAMFEENKIPFFDVAELGPSNIEKEDLFIDYCHLTPSGAELVASRICKILYPKLVQRIRNHAVMENQQSVELKGN